MIMEKNPSITFVLSSWGRYPIGGLRIIYEYATRLSKKNWHVNIIHPARLFPEKEHAHLTWIRNFLGFYKNGLLGTYLPKKWFRIDPRVNMLWVRDLREEHIPKADFIIACPVNSADFVHSYLPDKGKKYYFIQHFEDWVFPAKKVEETWKLPLKKIVISRWLQKKAEAFGEPSIYIPNGLDFESFNQTIPFKKRNLKSVLFMSHFLTIKGTDIAIQALLNLKKRHFDMEIHCFGVLDRNPSLPDYIVYHKNPPQPRLEKLYNSCRFFLSPSLSEGWPLPPAEAMMCGCVVIATDIPGHHEYITDGDNGIMCSPGSPAAIVEKLDFLFKNPSVAETIALRARESLKPFNWDSRVALFEKALLT
jgi:glycosyltransferase involved in cell wall biosynthesis